QRAGHRTGVVGIDGWLNLPGQRFNPANPAGHFYNNALRFEEMFAQLVFPLRSARSIRVEADFAEEQATSFRKHTYAFTNLDIVILEGIYLLKREFQAFYDYSVWIECTFETALERALQRGQEGLSIQETIDAYRTIYFPAQEIHLSRDHPREAASEILNNDPRLA